MNLLCSRGAVWAYGLLPALLLALAACDGGDPLRELNRGLPSLITVTADTAGFAQATPGDAFPVTVRLTDPYGDAVSGTTVAWRPFSGDGARVTPDTTTTDSDGRSAAMWQLGQGQGPYQLSASSPVSGATVVVRAQVR